MTCPSAFQYISPKAFEKLYQEKGLTGGEVESPLGPILYRILDGSICAIGFKLTIPFHNRLDKIFRKNYQPDGNFSEKVLGYLFNEQAFPILLIGTPFQHKVWQELQQIPKGQCLSYQDVAERLGDIKKVRAVASAVGRNPISWIVPCHRVIPKQGGIGQYLWGSTIKAKLLELEGYERNTA